MPEANLVLQTTDLLIKALYNDGKWLNFIGISMFGRKFIEVNINLLEKCIDLPIIDIFCKGKEYFICLSNDITIRAHHKMDGEWAFKHSEDNNTHFQLDFGETLDTKNRVQIFYINSRFGEFDILTSQKELQTALDKLAYGFIGKFILTKEAWTTRILKYTKKKSLRTALMNQKELCSGWEIFY